MSVRNQNWYDLNESRLWPFDDRALLTDDSGTRLPNDLLADIYLRFPSTQEERAFIGALTVGPSLVTLIVLSTSNPVRLLASISLPKPVTPRRHYDLTPVVAGAGGWVVFGKGIDDQELRSYRFADPIQSLLLAQTARAYRQSPIPGVGKLFGSQQLTGLVRLQGGNDVRTAVEEREINGVVRDVIVVRLAEGRNVGGQRNLLSEYAGNCGQRPESLNCEGPSPVEAINSVTPDCCGTIYVEFRGHGQIKALAGECGVLVDVGIGLSESCVTPDRLPDEFGRLPNEYADLCTDADSGATTTTTPAPPPDFSPQTRPPATGLPYYETFEDLTAEQLNARSGEFAMVAESGYKVLETQEDRENLIVWDEGLPTESGWDCLYKRIRTTLNIRPGSYSAKNNGGLLINYVDDRNYFRVDLEADLEKTFRVVQVHNGNLKVLALVRLPTLTPGYRYKLEVDVVPLSEGSNYAVATARVTGLTDGISQQLSEVLLPGYLDNVGLLGLWSNQSLTWFENLEVEDYQPL